MIKEIKIEALHLIKESIHHLKVTENNHIQKKKEKEETKNPLANQDHILIVIHRKNNHNQLIGIKKNKNKKKN